MASVVAATDNYEFMTDKVFFSITDNTTELTALATAASTDLSTLGLDGRAMNINIDMNSPLFAALG